jgi:DNA-binding transcriptional LysR family regulator
MNRTALSELIAIAAVATHRSFRGAARELGMSPSALSHAVSTLEQKLGVRLFHRTTRSVSPTEAGVQFLARVNPALREISSAFEDAGAHHATPTGSVRINASEGAARQLMDTAGYEFLRRYPGMKLDVVTESRMVDIVEEGFDAGIRQAGHVPQDMIAVPCTPPIRFRVAGSPVYFAEHRRMPKTPDDLRKHTCIRARLPGGAPYKWEFAKHDERIEIEVNGSLTMDSMTLMLDAALEGMGLIWTSEWAMAGYLADGRLIPVLDDWAESIPGLCLYYPGHRHVPAGLRALIEVIRERVPRK